MSLVNSLSSWFASWLPWSKQLCSTMLFCCDVSTLEPDDHRLQSWKPWAKISISFFKLLSINQFVPATGELTNTYIPGHFPPSAGDWTQGFIHSTTEIQILTPHYTLCFNSVVESLPLNWTQSLAVCYVSKSTQIPLQNEYRVLTIQPPSEGFHSSWQWRLTGSMWYSISGSLLILLSNVKVTVQILSTLASLFLSLLCSLLL